MNSPNKSRRTIVLAYDRKFARFFMDRLQYKIVIPLPYIYAGHPDDIRGLPRGINVIRLLDWERNFTRMDVKEMNYRCSAHGDLNDITIWAESIVYRK